ncbi:MAG: glycoside hydrolase family 75 protein [Flavobacterium sp.]
MEIIKPLTQITLAMSLLLVTTATSDLYKTIGKTNIYNVNSKNLYYAKSGFMIDADGAPKAYHKDKGIGLDYIDNAGKPGNWWALATDNKKANGTPLIQKATDPAPGYYISMTSLTDASKKYDDPKRYVNSETVPYIAIPPKFASDFKKGDIALVINQKNNKRCYAIVADIGPNNKFGEGSIYLASQLGINSNPKKGGTANNIVYFLFKNSGNGKVMSNSKINEIGKSKLNEDEIDKLLKLVSN